MKEHWQRSTPVLAIDAAGVALLLEPLYGQLEIEAIEPVPGGLTNTNIRVRLLGRPNDLLLHFYQRGPQIGTMETALIGRIAASVPVPKLLHFARSNPLTGHAYAIFDWVEGVPLDAVVLAGGGEDYHSLGTSIGRTLAAIHAFTFDKFGFLDARLQVKHPIDIDGAGLLAYLRQCLVEGPGGARLGFDLTAQLMDYVAREGDCLSDWLKVPRLTHGDFNGTNILVRSTPGSVDFDVTAILDWEYAFSGSPAFDFGNLLRPPVGAMHMFVDGLARGYCEAGGILPPDWQRIARLADLFSWADVLHRPQTDAAIIEDARAAVHTIIADWRA